MSNLAGQAAPTPCHRGDADCAIEILDGRKARLGEGLVIRRLLPQRARRMIGAWCFLDHFGPLQLAPGDAGMRVGPHPHIGLQTVTWLLAGEVFHRDSLGSAQLIRPGAVNLMTAGRGISHSEETPVEHGSELYGVQLWIALPEADHATAPAFEHHAELPRLERDGLAATVFMGEGFGLRAPTRAFSSLVAAEIVLEAGVHVLPLAAAFEHGLVPVQGGVKLDGRPLAPGQLAYLPPGGRELHLSAEDPCRLMLVGGKPFEESVILWWNFVGRSHAEIEAARSDWERGSERFGTVSGYDGAPLSAPELVNRLKR